MTFRGLTGERRTQREVKTCSKLATVLETSPSAAVAQRKRTTERTAPGRARAPVPGAGRRRPPPPTTRPRNAPGRTPHGRAEHRAVPLHPSRPDPAWAPNDASAGRLRRAPSPRARPPRGRGARRAARRRRPPTARLPPAWCSLRGASGSVRCPRAIRCTRRRADAGWRADTAGPYSRLRPSGLRRFGTPPDSTRHLRRVRAGAAPDQPFFRRSSTGRSSSSAAFWWPTI